MRKIFLAAAIATQVLAAGCASVYESADAVAEGVGEGVTFYCDNTDVYVREQFGIMVNAHAAPNSIIVTCANGYRLDTLLMPKVEPVTVPGPAPAPAPAPAPNP